MDPRALKVGLVAQAKRYEKLARQFYEAAGLIEAGREERRAARAGKKGVVRKGHTMRTCEYRDCKRRFRGHVDQKYCTVQHGWMERQARAREAKAKA